jgi:3-oxoacyl-[acyl-carrier-protein] synthase-3
MKAQGIGIVGLGSYLPPEVRKNDFWSLEAFEAFQKAGNADLDLGSAPAEMLARLRSSESGRIALEEMAKWKDDPFHGALERRVTDSSMRSSDMEVEAARDALEDAGLEPGDIDLMLLNSFLPDQAVPGNSGLVHSRLGLRPSAPAIEVDGVCGSFAFQLQMAASYILAGAGKRVLIVQSALQSRIADYRNPLSTTFGDAATAAVLGPVAGDRGILSCVSTTDGSYAGVAVLAAQNGAPWYDAAGARLVPHSTDALKTKEVVLRAGEMAKASIQLALEEANARAEDVQFFTSHQTIAAFGAICRRAAGLGHTRTLDSFRSVGSISACAIPLNLKIARQEGLLRDGDLAAVFTTGAGFNWSAAIFRWGTA